MTTHLSAIKTFAASRSDAVCAAMEFDDETGRPNYRLHAGLSGRSRALSVARERGIPEPVLERARADPRRSVAAARGRGDRGGAGARAAARRGARAGRRARGAAREAARLERERRKLAEERERMLAEGLAGFERARQALSRKVADELDAARKETARLAHASASRVIEEAEHAAEAEHVIAEARRPRSGAPSRVAEGGRARVRGLGAEGTVVAARGRLGAARHGGQAPAGSAVGAGAGRCAGAGTPKKTKGVGRDRAASPGRVTRLRFRARTSPATRPRSTSSGMRLEEAIEAAEKALDQAVLAGAARLRLVHGHGTGRLRDGLRRALSREPARWRRCVRERGREGGRRSDDSGVAIAWPCTVSRLTSCASLATDAPAP